MIIKPMPGYVRSPKAQKEMDDIVAELRALNPPKPRPVRPEGMSDFDFILSLQQPSTAMVLKMTDEEAAAHRARPMVTIGEAAANKEALAEYQKNPTPENYKKLVGARDISPEEMSHIEAIRRRPKNSTGQSDLSATTPERREHAVQTILYTPGAKVTKAEVEARAVNLTEYKTTPVTETWVELPWWKALFHKLKGNKIRSENTD